MLQSTSGVSAELQAWQQSAVPDGKKRNGKIIINPEHIRTPAVKKWLPGFLIYIRQSEIKSFSMHDFVQVQETSGECAGHHPVPDGRTLPADFCIVRQQYENRQQKVRQRNHQRMIHTGHG